MNIRATKTLRGAYPLRDKHGNPTSEVIVSKKAKPPDAVQSALDKALGVGWVFVKDREYRNLPESVGKALVKAKAAKEI